MLYCVCSEYATVAQQVEQLTRNEQVARSNRVSSSKQKADPDGVGLLLGLLLPDLVSDSRVSEMAVV